MRGNEKQAKAYIQKIRHETLRITVIQRLEEYLKPPKTPPPPALTDDEELAPPAPPPEPEVRMWEDLCKRLFLLYYHIYLVTSFSVSKLTHRKLSNMSRNKSKKAIRLIVCLSRHQEIK